MKEIKDFIKMMEDKEVYLENCESNSPAYLDGYIGAIDFVMDSHEYEALQSVLLEMKAEEKLMERIKKRKIEES